MRVLVTGANGFIGKNLVLRLRELPDIEVVQFVRGDADEVLLDAVRAVDAVIHLAGENRPPSIEAFDETNVGLTRKLCEYLSKVANRCLVVLASSTQAELENPYGNSKRAAEALVEDLSAAHGNPVVVYRLPGVFGKWCRPNYNSVVATFCYNIANALPIQVSDPSRSVRLVYVDDVLTSFLTVLRNPAIGALKAVVSPEYVTTLGELSDQIFAFRTSRETLVTEPVGIGFVRALYATYMSYLPVEKFAYKIPVHGDARGVFVEMLKTPDAGQFSFFTAHPGVTRGSHYHHTKTEKFLVIKGAARFGFRHLVTHQLHYLETSGDSPEIVETIPGWVHDITNVGDVEMVVLLWANENFDRSHPDTVTSKV